MNQGKYDKFYSVESISCTYNFSNITQRKKRRNEPEKARLLHKELLIK